MSLGYHNQIYSNVPFKADLAINAPLAKPIETVQKTIEGSVDTLVGLDEKRSKQTRNAIAVGSSVVVLSGLVALLNPRFSPKIIEKLKTLSHKAGKRADKNKHDTFWNKFYKLGEAAVDKTIKSIGFVNNFNSAKDAGFKWFCTEKKDFLGVHNKSTRNVLKKIDGGIRKVLKKPHEAITKLFDKISRHTVLSKYSKASKRMDSLEELINMHKDKLSESQKLELETKLTEIRKMREYFSESQTGERFTAQEQLMTNLERDFWSRYRAYRSGFGNKWQDKGEHINKNLTFWAQEILQPAQTKIEANGGEAVSKLVGEEGVYKEVFEMLSPHLSLEENALFKKRLQEASVSLRKANKSECVDYFGKKRDLMLGSAPTDILTALFGLSMSGIALSTADNNDERVSKLLTGVFPIIGGLGANMVFAAKLISGPIAMISGSGVGVLLNIIGSYVNKNVLGNNVEMEVNGD